MCTANICRSPVAAAILRSLVEEACLEDVLEIGSCGIADQYAGQGAAPGAVDWAVSRGYDLSKHRARLFRSTDFGEFDLILGMGRAHVDWLRRMRPSGLVLERFLDHVTGGKKRRDVPDPFGGTAKGYDRSFRMIEEAMPPLISSLRRGTLESALR